MPVTDIAYARSFSFYLERLFQARPQRLEELALHQHLPFDLAQMQAFANWDALIEPDALMPVLRHLRQAVMARLICRDLAGHAPLEEVVSTISTLAEFAVQRGLIAARHALAPFGEAIGEESGEAQELIVIAMGKLGGKELNVSSDIDLIFVYPEDGDTNGARSLSNHEYFTRLGKQLIRIISEPGPDGLVFRVDMRLRPYGDSGPLVMSFAALENYLLTQGREWERYAWIKARALSGDAAALWDLVRPFVYRKYLDYGAYGAMRELHAQIRREVARRDMAANIKLGPGGIREVEFIAQVFQLIRGGREKSLQLRGTRATLKQLKALHLMEDGAIDELQQAYAFLRKLEHHLQYTDDQQTQTLPSSDEACASLAHSMGFNDWHAFMNALNLERRHVTRHFEQVFFLPTEDTQVHPLADLWRDILEPASHSAERLAALGYTEAEAVARQLAAIASSQRYLQMPERSQRKFNALIPPLIEVASHQAGPDATLIRILALLEAISRRASYLALLSEYPQTLQRLATLCSASAWVSAYLTRHPILLDELLDARVLYATPDWPQLAVQLESQLAACEGDAEGKMDALRHFQHAQVFRLVAQDIAGMWTLEALSDELSRLADLVLAATLRHAWLDIAKAHTATPRFAIVGYGKLGGKELGYASDLDIIFLYDDTHPDAPELYARLARKMSTWLTSTTSAGVLYDIDLRLRPNGQSGLLVSTVSAFASYQRQQAWVWEHQALTRARFVAGDAEIGEAFDRIRCDVLMQARDLAVLKQEVVDMRQRMLETHPARDDDIKHARGGIIDAEFIIQALILGHAHALPALTANTGTIALLAVAAEAGLIDPALARKAQDAYRHYRRLQHAARLNDKGGVPLSAELLSDYQAVRTLWQAVFGQSI
ncbi:bifunctional [glutamate--ammonia ligase]-adenylyl-L-tyrosine phosphorylase/[glutamate--ammonia-ligase] adenylyltransferase [Craterilacuibacter sp. RT1T]|uniref:bifunctional [glutamate--ammonia ligase]-adenylyl-L-tyrosine phosphorylase/[glutamate--ammonia-ligase] adenylyltransferase n=1 Tax=Craterilacuibacter sp. RT1T TaxID=2942211 RepID=UPI0020C0C3F3|nr:bifunctional [glutamate--ammonia ligase]-adenylyl-L-tyrosine phosphorylase/[glutamate--ammonia-ligase] adenylyltransferase [Craterilacuibacter sp. RT1T]MCL6263173.1 bifunctional [glutamate--ammonia ligase]-adenylyl-L-tyrosine phosphorylase/[glutamate--ammonia-ligase] adenylyltransferase [Craterilacuibacter sp. RT1T]